MRFFGIAEPKSLKEMKRSIRAFEEMPNNGMEFRLKASECVGHQRQSAAMDNEISKFTQNGSRPVS